MKSKINTVIKEIIEKIKGKIVWFTVMLSFLIALFVYIFIACYARNLKVLIAGLFGFTAPLLTFLVYFNHTKPLIKKNIFQFNKEQ